MDIDIFAIVLSVAHLFGLLSTVPALLSTRTSQGTIAWVISLNTFPLLAVPAYWIFGRTRFRGYVHIRQSSEAGFRRAISHVEKDIEPYFIKRPKHGRLLALEQLAMMPFTTGNQATLLIDGQQTFDDILAHIDTAERYVLVQFFIVRDDGLGGALQRCLIDKARQGVAVYFLYDEIGSHSVPRRYWRELSDAGVVVREFQSTRGPRNRFQLNFRNHRKVVVVDGRHGWVGGLNVGDEYLGNSRRFGPWRDTHVRITGPAVLGLQLSFLEDWHWATEEIIDLSWQPQCEVEDGHTTLILPSGPADRFETASLMVQLAIHVAQDRLWIATPYLVPDEGVKQSLLLAAMRGVDVRILIPDRPDHLLVYLSAFAFLGELMRAGVRIYRYTQGFMHQKVFLVDDMGSGIGTVNLDNRSFRLNFEITAINLDKAFADEVEEMLAADFERAEEMTIDDIEGRSVWRRLVSRAAYLTAPVQ